MASDDQLAYTFSKAIDNGSTTWVDNEYTNTAGAQYPYDPRINRGVADYDVPHNFVANFVYEIPVSVAMKSHSFSNALLAGWQMWGSISKTDGQPNAGFSLRSGLHHGDFSAYRLPPTPDFITSTVPQPQVNN